MTAVIKKQLPKNRRVIKFHRAFRGLEPMDEYWESSTFEQREQEIIDFFIKETKFPPSKHLSYIRSTNVPILGGTTMEDLKSLTQLLHQRFGLTCFQISIDRTQNFAYFLFDFVDRKNKDTFEYNVTDYKYMLVTIYQYLDLYQYDLPEDLVRYDLVMRYKSEPDVYQKIIDNLANVGIGRRSYWVIRHSLKYSQQVCKEIINKIKTKDKINA